MARILDALDLAWQPLTAAALADDTPAVAQLDLRAHTPVGVGDRASPVRRVAGAFAKRRAAGHDLTLVVSSGLVPPDTHAALIAASLTQHGGANTPIAVVRGENVHSAIEEWHAGGEALRSSTTNVRFLDSRLTLVAAFAPAPQQVIDRAIASGAGVVITTFADLKGRHAENSAPPSGSGRHPVVIWTVDRYEAREVLSAAPDSVAALTKSVRAAATNFGVELAIHRSNDDCVITLVATSPDRDRLASFSDWLEHALPHPADQIVEGPPLRDRLHRVLKAWRTDVAADRLEFGNEVRPARQWVDPLTAEAS